MARRSNHMQRQDKALRTLYDAKTVDHVVHWFPKPGLEAEAKAAWQDSGVCPECWRRSVSGGRCAECGWVSPERAARDAALAAEAKKREEEIAQAIADYEDGQ